MRIYELSKEIGSSNKEVMQFLTARGVDVKNHMAHLSPEDEAAVRTALGGGASRSQNESSGGAIAQGERIIELRPMAVSEFAELAGKPVADVVLSLLRQRIVASKNQMLTEVQISQLAAAYAVKVAPAKKPSASRNISSVASQAGGERRAPVVVIIGHVDHGKTTLLDYIRKTRVAAREAGGITQHLGAYQVATPHGDVVFLDTPGHEAFSMIRVRGIRCADIAILVVAADDGVMPQTIEAIERAQAAGIQVIVALNKIDKASPQQIEATRNSLSRYGIVPEEWGGQTVVVPISAKTGAGVDVLLDSIVLQSQVMDLLTDTAVPASGFVLEAQMERGLGAVATVICQRGTLRVGDFFACGETWGKVTVLIGSTGKRVSAALPSQPVRVVGFDALPQAGDLFEVFDAEAYQLRRSRGVSRQVGDVSSRAAIQDPRSVVCIMKADNASSREALLESVKSISSKVGMRPIYVVHSAVGPVVERDVQMAADVHATIVAFHVQVEPAAQALATHLGVSILRFNIIYRILEALEKMAYEPPVVKKVYKKIGEAAILKVFDIKGVGIVAGGQVTSGRFSRDGKVVVWRGRQRLGEGLIKSLQRDKKSVKEVHAGFEFAFSVEALSDFAPDDRIECYQEVAEGS